LSRIHSLRPDQVPELLAAAEKDIQEEVSTVGKLAKKASEQAYYRWNFTWTRSIQDVVCRVNIPLSDEPNKLQCYTILLSNYLKTSTLLTIEEVGVLLQSNFPALPLLITP
jgi:hypothetical protein